VTVFEKSDRIGGLLRYGIPEFKLEKRVLDRRLDLLSAEGVVFRPGVQVGEDVRADDLRRSFDAVLLAGGAGEPRDLDVPGRGLAGIRFAMDYLSEQNRRCQGDELDESRTVTAAGKHVIIIGGGDTGADCLGTVHRHGAASVRQLELLPPPPTTRAADNPWPLWPNVFRTSSAHEEGGERQFSMATAAFSGTAGHVRALHGHRVERAVRDGRVCFNPVPNSAFELQADLVLLAMGFVGPVRNRLLDDFDVRFTDRGNVWRDNEWMTSVPGVFAAGDMQRGQSLIVWAIDDGRRAAAAIDGYLAAT
jgi:glutamate synthase (NADPH/NADH) small chain